MTDPRKNLPHPDETVEKADSEFRDRIDRLASEAREARASFNPPADPPDEDRALELCRDGLGPVVAVYLEAHAGEGWTEFSGEELDSLHAATNTHLELYTACYGVEMDPDFTVREAAELLIDTHDIGEVAALLTRVPGRDE